MKIAICDNDISSTNKLKHILYRYSNINNFEFLVETFKSCEDFLHRKDKFCIVFIESSLINRIEIIKQIKNISNTSKIFILSDNQNFLFESVEINAYRFLKKPFDVKTVYKILNQIFLGQEIHHPLWIKEGVTTHCIDTSEIVYIEADNKYCYIHLNDGIIWCKKTMARVLETLPKLYFLKINRAFVININFINKYNHDSVFLKNGEDLHITRTYYNDFKKNFTIFSNPKII